jgi:DNA-binding MarR family transcriptional regulator
MDLEPSWRDHALIDQANKPGNVDVGAVESLIALQGAAAAVNGAIDRFLARYGLSQGRFAVLILLMEAEEGLKPSEIAEGAAVRRATISGLLDGLERDGLVRRAGDDKDRRAQRVVMTQVARGLMGGLLKEFFARTGNWFGGVSGGGRRTIEGVLRSIVEKIPEEEEDAKYLPPEL